MSLPNKHDFYVTHFKLLSWSPGSPESPLWISEITGIYNLPLCRVTVYGKYAMLKNARISGLKLFSHHSVSAVFLRMILGT